MTVPIRASVEETISAFTRDEWRRVSGPGLYSSYGWLSSVEADRSYTTWYVAARSASGTLLAVLPVYLWTGLGARGGVASQYDAYRMFAEPLGLDAGRRRWLPALLLGGRAAYSTELEVRRDLAGDRRARVVGALLDELECLCDDVKPASLSALYLTPSALRELGPALGESSPLLSEANASLDLSEAASFGDYLRQVSRNRRTAIRREVTQFEAAGYELEERPLSACIDTAGRLLAAHHRSHGHGEEDAEMIAYLARQAAQLDPESRVLLCRSGGRDVAFCLTYEWNDRLYARTTGFVPDVRRSDFVVFNVTYYANIVHCVRRGLTSYDLGVGSPRAKALRGATLEPRWSLVRGPDGLVLNGHAAARWNDSRFASLSEQVGDVLDEDALAYFRDSSLVA
jgi:predicted N-acyltransferase